jgi:hypothetical protein
MRALFAFLFLVFVGGSANASIIQINYTGTYTGTIVSGNPATSQFTTTYVSSTPFDLTLRFDTSRPNSYYSETPSGSVFNNLFSSAGSVSGTFFMSGTESSNDTASIGSTSQSLVSRTISKVVSNTPSLFISVSHPDIPASITQPFSILSGLTGSGTFNEATYSGVFSAYQASYQLHPETITVTVDGVIAAVPEPSTWAMLLIGFAGIGLLSYRRHQSSALSLV